MSARGTVAGIGAVALGFALLAEKYAIVAGVLVTYVVWMLIRDWLGRREKYSGWTDITRESRRD